MEEEHSEQELDAMESILREETIGYLGLSFEENPYVVPLNYLYAAGTIVFHCGFEGKKIDFLKANPRVCFSVGRQSGVVHEHGGGSGCHVDNDSVICYGTARMIEDLKARRRAMEAFNRRFDPAAAELTEERVRNCSAVEIQIGEMTGRKERERKHTHLSYTFAEHPPVGL